MQQNLRNQLEEHVKNYYTLKEKHEIQKAALQEELRKQIEAEKKPKAKYEPYIPKKPESKLKKEEAPTEETKQKKVLNKPRESQKVFSQKTTKVAKTETTETVKVVKTKQSFKASF